MLRLSYTLAAKSAGAKASRFFAAPKPPETMGGTGAYADPESGAPGFGHVFSIYKFIYQHAIKGIIFHTATFVSCVVLSSQWRAQVLRHPSNVSCRALMYTLPYSHDPRARSREVCAAQCSYGMPATHALPSTAQIRIRSFQAECQASVRMVCT